MAANKKAVPVQTVESSDDSNEKQMVFMKASVAMKKQMELIEQLPDSKKWPFGIGPLTLSFNAGLVGVIGNSFFRRMLMVRKALFLSSLPMVLMPALIMTPAWTALLSRPILLGETKCTICADVRGGVVNFVLGAVYPVLLAAPLNAALAKRYETVKVPTISFKNFDRTTFVEFWLRKTRYFKGQFVAIAVFQTCFGMYMANSQMRVVREELSSKLHKV